jgi:manganese/zinc/iron transport system substrate-binding protein
VSTAPRVLAAAAPALAALALAACGLEERDGTAASGDGAVRVTTTTNFITDTAAAIGGERVSVEALMGPGVDPHLYRASSGDVEALRDADLVLYGGLELEGKMEEVLEELGESRPVVAVTERIPNERLLPADPTAGGGEHDPHVWFDVSLWRIAAETIRDALIEVDPEGRGEYEANARAYLDRLDRLDAEVAEWLATIPERRRVLITSHDAFRYLGEAYDVEVAAIQGVSTQAEATTADIERIAALIAERGIRAVFVESSVPQQTIDAVLAAAAQRGHQAEVGGELFSDAAGEQGTPEGTYVGMVEHNVERLVEGLR